MKDMSLRIQMTIFLGLAVMILMGPLNAIVAKKMKKYQLEQMKNKDQRIRIMDEILNGMKILKLYAWETSFQQKVKMKVIENSYCCT